MEFLFCSRNLPCMKSFNVGIDRITLASIDHASRGALTLKISTAAVRNLKKSRAVVEKVVKKGRPVYGINTGFGKLADRRIKSSELEELQNALVKSHSTGFGKALTDEEVRALLFLRAHSLGQGFSGVTTDLIQRLATCYNKDILPVIPEGGSVGSCGDLSPLSHLAATLAGMNPFRFHGREFSSLQKFGLKPYRFREKEGLALINGTQASLAITACALIQAQNLARIADVAGAMTIDGIHGSIKPFSPGIQTIRKHAMQSVVAANVRALLEGSKILESHKYCGKIQDGYSVRCIPQVHGAARHALEFSRELVENEANSAIDNPVVFPSGQIISGGNFHGQYVSVAAENIALAICYFSNMSERRIESLVNPDVSGSGLQPFLTPNPGLNCGFMNLQVAAASATAENRALAFPISVNSVPTSAGKEDVVSMSTPAAARLRKMIENLEIILGIELICNVQAIDLRKPIRTSKANLIVRKVVRQLIPYITKDERLSPHLASIQKILRSGAILESLKANGYRIN